MDTIGHYTIVSELGRGGMGVVYKAHEESLNRFVAIKVLGEHLAEDPSFLTRFVREAQAAAALNHPNIIQIYFIGEDRGRHYFVMEYVSGRSLLSVLRDEGRIATPRAARLVLQAANGLAAAHDKGFLHRDIKPANLMVGEDGLLKIADFGLALPREALTRLTASGMLVGTPGYLSPEQCRDEELDQRTDIYSLGVTFYEILGGRLPFLADSPLALLRKILEDDPPDISALNDAVDDDARRIVHRMIAKDRDARYADCHELGRDLERYLEALGARGAGGLAFAAGGASAPPAAGIADGVTERMRSDVAAAVAAAGGSRSAGPRPAVARTSPTPSSQPPGSGATTVGAPIGALAVRQPAMVVSAASTVPEVVGGAPPRRSRAPVIALVAVVVAVAAVAGALVALREPLRERFSRTTLPAAAVDVATGQRVETPSEALQSAPAAVPRDAAAVAPTGAGAGGLSTAPAGGGSPSPAAVVAPDGKSRRPAEPRPAPVRQAPGPTLTVDEPAVAGSVSGAAEPGAAALRGLAVAVVGAPPLAGIVGDLLQSEIATAGVTAVDATSLPATGPLLADGAEPPVGELVRAARADGLARLLVSRIEPVGERELVFMGRRDVAYTSRVTVACFDAAAGRMLGRPGAAIVEYTSLNVQGVSETRLRPVLRAVLAACR